MLFSEPFFCDCRRRHSHSSFPRRCAPAASIVANAVFLPIGVVGMTRTKRVDQIAIIPAARIFISDEQRDRRAGGLAFKDTGEDFDRIGFLPLRDVAGGAWLASI